MSRILIVEDEAHLADGLKFNLEAEGYSTEVADSGEQARDLLTAGHEFDLLILDIMLPGIDGFVLMRELRERGELVPTLMLTARGRPEDVLHGFEAGADDYLMKPFDLPILIARVKGLLRRRDWSRRESSPPKADVYEFAGRRIDFDKLELTVDGRTLQLTLMEANVLRFLIAHEGKAVSRQEMLEQVWGLREDTDTRAIDNFIVRLRKYIEPVPANPCHLLTVRSVGYRFVAKP